MPKALRRPSTGWSTCGPSRSVQAHDRHIDSLAACSVGNPRAFTAAIRALMDSMALVVQLTVLISRSERRNGPNSAHAFSHSHIIARVTLAHFPEMSANRCQRLSSRDAAVYTGLRSFAICARRALRRTRMNSAGDEQCRLHDGLLPHGIHAVRRRQQAFEAVETSMAHVPAHRGSDFRADSPASTWRLPRRACSPAQRVQHRHARRPRSTPRAR